jgi:hypothetical protein
MPSVNATPSMPGVPPCCFDVRVSTSVLVSVSRGAVWLCPRDAVEVLRCCSGVVVVFCCCVQCLGDAVVVWENVSELSLVVCLRNYRRVLVRLVCVC